MNFIYLKFLIKIKLNHNFLHILQTRTIVKKAKRDILSFFYDDERLHWIYNYGDNLNSSVSGKSVFYLQQLKVLFENKYFHWNTGFALQELVAEGELINWKENLRDVSGKNIKRISLYRRPDIRYFKKNAKKILECINYFDENFNKACGRWGEFLTEHFLLKNEFRIIDRHTNKFNDKKWEDTDHDLDLITTKDDLYYGIEVKNRFEYMDKEEFKIKIYDICSYLNLIPVCVSRFAPYYWLKELSGYGGRLLIFKRKIFPLGFENLAHEIWDATLLPVQTSNHLSDRGESLFLQWHEQNIRNFH